MKAYGSLELTDASPPQAFYEPIALADIRTWLGIANEQDDAQDALLSSLITAARETAEILQNRDLIQKQYDMHLDLLLGYDALQGAAYPLRSQYLYNLGVGYEIPLREPLQSVELFQYTDNLGATTTLAEGIDYLVDPSRHWVIPPFNQLWPFFAPQPSSAVLIRFTSGYSATHPFWQNAGQRLIQGMRMLIAAWHEGRLPFQDIRNVAEVPYAVTTLLSYGARPRVR